MAEDEVSVNNQMEKEPGIQELSPWMRKRLEDRARPFSPQGLIELLLNGSKLTKSVIKHTSINDVLSRIRNLGFLSKSYRSIILRTARAEPPNIYRMLDLPWFRGGSNRTPLKGQSSHFRAKEESVSPAKKQQSSEPSIESLVSKQEKAIAYIARLMQPPISRRTTIITGNSIGPNHVISKPKRIERKTQVDYLTYPTNQTEQRSIMKTGTPSGLSNFNEINRPQDFPKTSEHQPSHVDIPTRDTVKSSRSTPFETGSYETVRQPDNVNKGNSFGITIDKGEQANTSRRNTRTGHVGDDKRKIRLIENPTTIPHSEQTSKAIQPSSMTPALSEKEIDITNETGGSSDIFDLRVTTNNDMKLDTIRQQITNIDVVLPSPKLDSITANRPILPDNQEMTNFKTDYTEQKRSPKDTEHEVTSNRKLADNGIENVKPGGTRQTLGSKDANQRYPAQDLFYKKPLSIGQRIIQSLPFIRNIKRKEHNTLKPVSISKEKRDVLRDSISLKEIDLVYMNKEPKTVHIHEKSIDTASDAVMVSKADVVVLRQVGRPNDNTTQKDNPPSELPKIMIKRKEASQIYPFKDLVHTRMYSTRQQIVRSLPLIKNWSKTNLPVSRAGEKLIKSNGSQRSKNAPDIPQVQEINTSSSKPARSLPNFPTVADSNITGTYDDVLQNALQRLPDFKRGSNNSEIDLILSPTNQTNTTRQSDNYQPLDQLIHLRRDQSIASSLSTVQTIPDQTQTQNPTQTSTTQNDENNTNQNNNQPDIKALAREVYPLIRRMIIIERERRPSL